ncbi:hypothetical protein [Bremerella sp.]|uniref:hypothetical protein n=1 Tax=Bremerella sp. TaxID=2795602 RepID=UPI00391A7029
MQRPEELDVAAPHRTLRNRNIDSQLGWEEFRLESEVGYLCSDAPLAWLLWLQPFASYASCKTA